MNAASSVIYKLQLATEKYKLVKVTGCEMLGLVNLAIHYMKPLKISHYVVERKCNNSVLSVNRF